MSVGKLGSLLVSKGLITEAQLRGAVEHKNQTKTRLGASLVQLGHVNENVLVTFLSTQYGISAISLDGVEVAPEVVKLIPKSLCQKHWLVPVSKEGNRISIAISDPTNVSAVDDVRFLTNLDVIVYLGGESAIGELIERSYSGMKDPASQMENVAEFTDEEGGTNSVEVASGEADSRIDSDEVNSKPVIRLINKLFIEAIGRKVSDIHLEPFEAFTRVRFRIDGSLHEVMRLPLSFRAIVPARIKVMANLDIAEKRLPQDGRIQVRTKDKAIDIRVSMMPTLHGEKVVMRLLDQGGKTPDLTQSGLEEEQIKVFRKATSQPYGMVLVTGPTGSGKTTTLYGALSELNTPDVNISTAEDPVEYTLLGINQVQVKESIGMSFASALRSFLRQDPDIIMVGEIRDQETAEIAVKAALTGHMVFSTLHTNDAPSTISRMLHMGLEPFLITAAVTLIEAQRLVRVNCKNCREPDERVSREMLLEAEVPESWLESFTPMRGKGCERCGKTGYQGRAGLFEVMPMSEAIRNLVIKGANSDEIKRMAMTEGMSTLRQGGLIKLYRGETTLEEVLNNSRPDGDLVKS